MTFSPDLQVKPWVTEGSGRLWKGRWRGRELRTLDREAAVPSAELFIRYTVLSAARCAGHRKYGAVVISVPVPVLLRA